MGFRITTNMMMNTYRYNLQGSTKKLSDARDMVLTQRSFNSYADDPAAATQEFRLRRDFYSTYSQLNNTKNVYSKYNTAWNNLQGIKTKLIDGTAIESVMRGTNDTTGEARRGLATTLRETSESLIYALNQKLGDQFIFAGNDGLNVPFEWKGEDLLYRGINVRAGSLVDKPETADPGLLDRVSDKANKQAAVPSTWTDDDEAWYNYLSGAQGAKAPEAGTRPDWVNDLMKEKGTTDGEKAWLSYYKDKDDYMKLKEMSGEELYIDLGMGVAEKSPNNPVNGSYFNGALCGIDFIDFGVDEDGDPKNLALLMREFADIFQAWDENMDPQGYNPDLAGPSAQGLTKEELEEKAWRLLDKFKDSREHCVEKWDELDAQAVFLVTNQERLETLLTDTNTQILDVSQVDLADAITSFSWQQYCYNAALKIGNQLLSQSLIDYMR